MILKLKDHIVMKNFFDKDCLIYIDNLNLKEVVDTTKDFYPNIETNLRL